MIWKHLGFEKDIFFVTPLKPVEEDISLFYGRHAEIKKFILDALSGERALKCISGKIGVGKTTFVNACQFYSYAQKLPYESKLQIKRLLPCYEKIQLQEEDDLDSLKEKVLINICNSIDTYIKLKQLTYSDVPKQISEMINYYQNISIETGGKSIGASFNLTTIGGGLEVGTVNKSFKGASNIKNNLTQLIDFVKNNYNFEGLFVIINNLDIITKSTIVRIVNSARDELFDIDGIHWILIGHEGLGSMIESEVERVADYLSGTESQITPMSSKDVTKIVKMRAKALRMNDNVQCPLSDKSIMLFHYMSMNELRNTFRICSEVVKRAVAANDNLTEVSFADSIKHFMAYSHERAKSIDLNESHIKILSGLVKSESCRPKDFNNYGYTSTQGFISALQSLVKRQLLHVEERGRARFFYPTGMTMIAGLTGALGNEIKQIAENRFSAAQQGERIVKKPQFNEYQLTLFNDG